MDYDGETYTFDTDNELHDFIEREFKRAQREQGDNAALPDMIIHYPCPGLTGRYEIWDTPGPNYAGAGKSHEKIAEQCIRETDICIFVMNYSNLLTHDAVNFLQKMRDEAKKFIVVLNRIDERYSVKEYKSVSKILDYICFKFKNIGYKDFVIFGTSALQNYCLNKVVELAEAEGVPVNYESIGQLWKRYKEFKMEMRFIKESLYRLEDFHDIEEPTERELRIFSGVPQLCRYVNYRGEQVRQC